MGTRSTLSRKPAKTPPRPSEPKGAGSELGVGACFVLEHGGRYSAFWIASHYNGRDAKNLGVVCLDLETSALPTLEECERAPAVGLRPERGGTWQATQNLLYYRTPEKPKFLAATAECCVVIGWTRRLTSKRILWSSSSFGGPIADAATLRRTLLKIRELNADGSRRHRLGKVLELLGS